MFIHNFPYTDFHELNLDYLYGQITTLTKTMEEFTAVNELYYAGAWDISKAYPKYNIVVTPDNIGYISIQPVPIGIDISNTDYWAEIADFTAQIADLGSRVSTLESDVTSLNSSVSSLNQAVPEKKPRITAETKMLCIGNSYAYGSGGTGYSGWPYQLKDMLGSSNIDIIQQRGGDFCHRATTSSPAPTYPNMTEREALISFVGSHTTAQLAAYEYVIFGGGYNDGAFGYSYSDIVSEITSTVAYVRNKFPNAEIAIIPLSSVTHNYAGGGEAFEAYQTFSTAWADGAINNGCLTTTHSLNWFYGKTQYQGSGSSQIHLNDDGYVKCAQYIYSILNGWDGCLHEDLTDQVTLNTYVTLPTDGDDNPLGYVRCVRQGDVVHLRGHVYLNDDSDTGTYATHNLLTVPASCSTDRWASFQAGYVYHSGMYAPIMLSMTSAGVLSIRNNTGILSQFDYSTEYQIIFDLVIPYGM